MFYTFSVYIQQFHLKDLIISREKHRQILNSAPAHCISYRYSSVAITPSVFSFLASSKFNRDRINQMLGLYNKYQEPDFCVHL